MSMPHAPPTPPPIIPIGAYFERNAETGGETHFFVGVGAVVLILLAVAHITNAHDTLSLTVLMFAGFLVLLVLPLVNKRWEINFITDESLSRNYLHRFVFPVGVSAGLLFMALFTLFLYPHDWGSMLMVAGLLGLAGWHLKLPDRKQSFTGTNSIGNYWRRISGKATFSQLDYGPGDTVHFSYEDGLVRNNGKKYHVFLNRIQERRSRSATGGVTWERVSLWSAQQLANADQLSKGLTFPVMGTSKNIITPSYYRLLYWEVILQEVDGSFRERFLVGVDRFRKVERARLKSLRA